ncbi:uncharacterized protein A4U43_C03F7370 [Asparagus officinalis]|uniref:Uncharacterized protein n=1 Tax=Asparagus officinalis TaxID=4686 RepID=A0A5P1F842_ASPOF|nr:uncharacterized protein A4U43_C03F7370 [Asparagus officinalis]
MSTPLTVVIQRAPPANHQRRPMAASQLDSNIVGTFVTCQAYLDKIASKAVIFAGKSKLKVAIYTGRRGSTCGVNSGRLLGKVTLPLDLKGVVGKGCVFHNGWVNVGRESKGSSAMLHLTVRSEPDPRFVFEFDGEPECSPQVFQVQGKMRQPVFTCKFSTYRPGDRNLRTSSLPSEPTNSRSWLSSFGSERERPLKERKGWYVTVHDVSGSTVAMASMATPFVASRTHDRVSSTNPGAWILFRLGRHILKPWGRLEAWRERRGSGLAGDSVGMEIEFKSHNKSTASKETMRKQLDRGVKGNNEEEENFSNKDFHGQRWLWSKELKGPTHRSFVELGCAQSFFPLHSVVVGARLTSHLSVSARIGYKISMGLDVHITTQVSKLTPHHGRSTHPPTSGPLFRSATPFENSHRPNPQESNPRRHNETTSSIKVPNAKTSVTVVALPFIVSSGAR